MITNADQFRYERKYVWFFASTAQIELALAQHPAFFQQPYPPRWVNSVYFDSPDYALLQQNSLGMQIRAKVRARWYTTTVGSTKPHLEIKHKDSEMNTKYFFDLNLDKNKSLDQSRTWQEVSSQVQSAVSEQISISQLLQPSMQNKYYRKYFASEKLNVRVTIDSNLHFKDINQHSTEYQPGFSIVEIKSDREADLTISSFINSMPLRVTKASKYEIGMRAVVLC